LRRRRDEPSNPFASASGGRPKASKGAVQNRRPHSDNVGKPQSMTKQEIAEALAKKRALASVDHTPPLPTTADTTPPLTQPGDVSDPAEIEPSSEQLDQERMDELARRSAETKAASKALELVPEQNSETAPVEDDDKGKDSTDTEGVAGPHTAHSIRGEGTTVLTHRTATITAQAATPMDDIAPRLKPPRLRDAKTNSGTVRPAAKRRRRFRDKGGGKQPQVRKLDRRKYLEYKYEVRAMLDDERVLDEHRSNILGQVWAKGERSGVTESQLFIEQKVAELILPEDIGEKISVLVKKFTTKR
jgi:hypothetical protein